MHQHITLRHCAAQFPGIVAQRNMPMRIQCCFSGQWSDGRIDECLIDAPGVRCQEERIPSMVHVDGTARPQIISNETNPRF
jgi:predicted NodU family carbamoyl transferase